ncbi:DUF5819 family protein [Streptomyces sp. NPDC001941]|uniref:DUF5819 family protein n=1 Tax=Streptomyces sp. NPDC001941 TaxID=3154659 RepID=UPI00332FADD3
MDSYDDEGGARVGAPAPHHRADAAGREAGTAASALGTPAEPSAGPPAWASGAQAAPDAPGTPEGAEEHAPAPPHPPRAQVGIAGLSLGYQVAAAFVLAVVGVLACVHLAMVFLHVAPSNTVTKEHGETIDSWIYPEFEQNWKLFAPNPLQQNIAVQVRAEVATADGGRRTTDWIDLSADDADDIEGNLAPSHVSQNELRRAWDFFVNSHTNDNKPNGTRGQLSERYVRRIAMLRLDGHALGGRVERIQLRSSTAAVKAPPWSDEKIDTRPFHRLLPWWTVTAADLPAGVRNGGPEAAK